MIEKKENCTNSIFIVRLTQFFLFRNEKWLRSIEKESEFILFPVEYFLIRVCAILFSICLYSWLCTRVLFKRILFIPNRIISTWILFLSLLFIFKTFYAQCIFFIPHALINTKPSTALFGRTVAVRASYQIQDWCKQGQDECSRVGPDFESKSTTWWFNETGEGANSVPIDVWVFTSCFLFFKNDFGYTCIYSYFMK